MSFFPSIYVLQKKSHEVAVGADGGPGAPLWAIALAVGAWAGFVGVVVNEIAHVRADRKADRQESKATSARTKFYEWQDDYYEREAKEARGRAAKIAQERIDFRRMLAEFRATHEGS
jgi:hypothetical protein